MSNGVLFYSPISMPLGTNALALPLCYYNFYLTGTTTPAVVYQDAGLTTPFPINAITGQEIVTANGFGQFAPIYLDPSLVYRVQFYNQLGVLISDVDPYIPPIPSTGNGPISLNPVTGQVTINAPKPGGTGVTLTVVAAASTVALSLVGQTPGQPLIVATNTLTTGTQTATFTATNKPGTATTAPSAWLPITGDGGTIYYIPLWQ
jgi:hypothetical protein